MMHGYFWGGWGLVTMLLFWGGVIILFAFLIRSLMNMQKGDHTSAKSILDERYAKGEINRDEYELMRRDIEA